jgi:SAM-dependent methyltransferase
MSLKTRSTAREVMDDEDLDEVTYQTCLADLAAINRLTRTHAATLRWLAGATKNLPPEQNIAILDVAYGQGDLLRAIAAWAQKTGRVVTLSGIDLNPRSAITARAFTPPGQNIAYHTGDVFTFTPAAQIDYIVTSQFTHHLPSGQIVALLRWMDATAARGWLIMDLQRHLLPFLAFPLLCRLMSWHKIVRHDGTISIASGFTRPEWRALLSQAGVEAKISWHIPFRHGITSA